jgi:predicted DNA-binding protein with PD1-like motif
MLTRIFTFLIITAISISCMNQASTEMPNIDIHAIRLKPGQDIKKELQLFAEKNNLEAAWISSAVGSITDYQIRFANQPEGTTGNGHFEILSLSGTLSVNGSHIHIGIADSTGKTIGGHLMEGCTVYTTAEIIIQSTGKYKFAREKDGTTPWEELQIKPVE